MNLKRLNSAGILVILICSQLLFLTCTQESEQVIAEIMIHNPSEYDRTNLVLPIDVSEMSSLQSYAEKNMLTVKDNGSAIPGQWTDDNNVLCLLLDLNAGEEKVLQLVKSENDTTPIKKLTQAEISIKDGGEWKEVVKNNGNKQFEYAGGSFKNIEHLKVPEQHTDHSFFIRYEGPGWESDKIGYRFYLDWRNAVDIFGKKTTEMVLHNVGQDGFDSYHEEADWGMDILKVGSSLGLGSIAWWDGENANRVAGTDSLECRIIENGALQSAIQTNYYGWADPGNKTDLTSLITIRGGSRLSSQQLLLSEELDNLCTGIVKHDSAELIRPEKEDQTWSYLATFGRQGLDDSMVGMVVFFEHKDLLKITQDQHSHVIVLKPENGALTYYFGATWEKDIDQINTKDKFMNYLESAMDELNNPIIIKEKI